MKKGFTLIELLIVVAIIAILAAIAVPNFLEAQTRSKVSRVKADLRTLVTGLEIYRLDFNAYPNSNGDTAAGAAGDLSLVNVSQNIFAGQPEDTQVLERLSTPIAYLSSGLLLDAFPTQKVGIPNNATGVYTLPLLELTTPESRFANRFYKYATISFAGGVTAEVREPGRKSLSVGFVYSSGPDNIKTELRGSGVLGTAGFGANQVAAFNVVYDPTNGTVSQGDVFRAFGEAVDDRGKFMQNAVRNQN
ncbi:MAG: prepilin-type N-terminal cleavage/methylation domain-containing protein [Sumerlaeia bacterium]